MFQIDSDNLCFQDLSKKSCYSGCLLLGIELMMRQANESALKEESDDIATGTEVAFKEFIVNGSIQGIYCYQ